MNDRINVMTYNWIIAECHEETLDHRGWVLREGNRHPWLRMILVHGREGVVLAP